MECTLGEYRDVSRSSSSTDEDISFLSERTFDPVDVEDVVGYRSEVD